MYVCICRKSMPAQVGVRENSGMKMLVSYTAGCQRGLAIVPRRLSRRVGLRALCLLVGALVCLTAVMLPARMAWAGSAVDETGSVDTAQVQGALDDLQDSTGKSLNVIFVDRLSGSSDTAAKAEFAARGLGSRDSLLVIAIASRQYSVYAGGEGFTRSELADAIDSSVTSQWRKQQWGKGVEALAKNLDSSGTAGASMGGFLIFIVLVIALGGGLYAFTRIRGHESRKELKAREERMHKKVAQALVRLDDTVSNAGAELRFAQAEFGEEAVAPYRKAYESAKERLRLAFVRLQDIDDNHALSSQQAIEALEALERDVSAVFTELDSHAHGFEELRDLANRLPEKISTLHERIEGIRAKIPLGVASLNSLEVMHTGATLTALATYPTQIEALLASAQTSLNSSEQALSSADGVSYYRLAEEAVEEASSMASDLVDCHGRFEEATRSFEAGITSLSRDIDDAQNALAASTTVSGDGRGSETSRATTNPANPRMARAEKEHIEAALAKATQVLRRVRQAGDPFAGTRELTRVEAEIDAALARWRSREEALKRLKKTLEALRTQATCDIEESAQIITRYSNYASVYARSTLTRARQEFSRGEAAVDPAAASTHFQRASDLALSARSQIDVSRSDGDLGSFLAGMAVSSLFHSRPRGGYGGLGGFGSTGGFSGGGRSGGGGFGGSF